MSQCYVHSLTRIAAVVTLAAFVTACGSLASSPRPLTDGSIVELRDNLFHPARVEVPVGTTVTWWWNDGFLGGHDLVGAEFNQPEQTSGTFSHRFDTPGTYKYVCTRHSGMAGTIVVGAADPTNRSE